MYVAFDWGRHNGVLGIATVSCNNALANGFLGATANGASAPTNLVADTSRPETRFVIALNDVGVALVYSIGTTPVGVASQVLQARIVNRGSSITNLPVTLTISGAQTFTDTQNVASLAACTGAATVSFAAWTPTAAIGSTTATVTISPNDITPADNSLAISPVDVSLTDYSYKYPGSISSASVGIPIIAGTLAARFSTTIATKILQVTLEFTTTGVPYRVIILNNNNGQPGSIAYLDATDRFTSVGSVTITLPSAIAVGPGMFVYFSICC